MGFGSIGKTLKKWKGTSAGGVLSLATANPLPLLAGAYYDTSKQQVEAQNKANREAVDRANAYDMYTWNLANQYNDPKQQMARLQAAGLNPNLVYGSGSVTGNTTSSAGSNGVASQEGFSVLSAVQKGLPMAQAVANLRNTNSQNELLQYQQGQTEAQTESIREHTKYLPQQMAYQAAQQKHLELSDAVLQHQLQWAQDHDTPVGVMPDYKRDIWNYASKYIKKKAPEFFAELERDEYVPQELTQEDFDKIFMGN